MMTILAAGPFYLEPTFFVAISFFLFIGILFWKKVPGMIAKALDERAEKIQAQLAEARNLKEESQALLAQYKRKHRDAEKDAADMITKAREEAEIFAKEAEANLEEAFRRQTRATEEKIAQAEARAVKEVKAAAVEAAVGAASQVLETNLKAGKHKKLVNEAIKDLDKRLN